MAAQPPPDSIYSFKGNQTEVNCLNFVLNSTEEKLLSGTRNGEVFIWDLETLSLSHSFSSGEGSCISLLVPDNQRLLTHNRGHSIRKWAKKEDGTYKETGSVKSTSLQYCSAQLLDLDSVRDKLVVFPEGEAKTVTVAELTDDKVVFSLSYPERVGNIMGLCSAGKGRIVAAFEAGDLILWDIRMSNQLNSYKMDIGDQEMNTAMCVAFNAEKSIGAVGTSNPQIESFTLEEQSNIKALPSIPITNPGVNQFCFRNDNKLMASAGWDSSVRVFSVRNTESKVPLRPLAVLPSYTSDKSLSCILFSPTSVKNLNNKFILAAAGEGCTVCLWDIYN